MSKLSTGGWAAMHIYNSNQTGSGAYATWLMAPTYFPRGGDVFSGSVQNAGSYGYWWSSTVNSATNARYLNLSSGGVGPENNSTRGNGFSLRCLLRRYDDYALAQQSAP